MLILSSKMHLSSEQIVTSKTISGKFFKRVFSFFLSSFSIPLMGRQLFFICRTLLLGFLFLVVAPAFASDSQNHGPHFSDLIITTSRTQLLLFGQVNNGISDEMRQGLPNGIPMQFTFMVELNKTEKNWPDLQLVALQFQHVLSYDPLQENYRLECSEKKKKVEVFADLEAAIKAINEINGLAVIDLSQLVPDSSYQLQVKANLYTNNLPMNLDSILPFASWWDVETDWHTIEFTY